MPRQFVHLHLHTDYSLLDGACQIDRMLNKALKLGMGAVAITDHGNLYGAVQFYEKALSKGIKPIIGSEVYIVSNMHDRQASQEHRYHLILLVKSGVGYRNLSHLVSLGHLEGFYYKPRIDFNLLEKYSDGLIALSACIQGEIPSLLGMDNEEQALKRAQWYKEVFGDGNFYLELQDHGISEQEKINKSLMELSKKTGIPLVATNDCHYIEKEDSLAQDALLCLQTGKKLTDENRMKFPTDQFYFKSPEEMEALFGYIPEALDNTLEIAERCEFEFDLSSRHYPKFNIPAGYTLDEYFEKTVREGFEKRKVRLLQDAKKGDLRHSLEDYAKRLDYEIGIIKKLDYAGYFLIVWDFIRYAKERGIPVGPGRGSAAGSLVAYSLRITDIDPLRYDLFFERFLNPERVSPPDIDIDFCTRRRDEVIHYVTEKYGKENVCQISAFGKMKARAVVRDVGRVLDMEYGTVDKIAKLIPFSPTITIEEAMKLEPRIEEQAQEDENIKELLEISKKLEGFNRHGSTHAAGVVISPMPLMDIVPLTRVTGKTATGGETQTQYTMKDIEKLGLLKMDFLGLNTLTVIDDTVKLIKKNRGIDINIADIPLDDKKTYELFSNGKTIGVFQFDGASMRNYLKRLKPNRFEDLVAMNALHRPGPIKGGMVDEYIRRKNGNGKIEYPIEALEPILESTYGVIVFQEQVMQIASSLAGFTLGEADILRKAMGKKQKEVMIKMKEKFIAGCIKNGIRKQDAQKLFELIEGFAEYGFNKSHSAAYAWIAYQTAYLKAHYPYEFMAALLTIVENDSSKIVRYIAECNNIGIPILPPSINESEKDFLPTQNGIRFGLGALKNVGGAAIEGILKARESGGPFKSFSDFCCRVDLRALNSRMIESIIKAGVFDELGYYRSQLIKIMDQTIEYAQKYQKDKIIGQKNLFSIAESEEELHSKKREILPPIPEWDKRKILSYEKEIIGFYISGHPLEEYKRIIEMKADASIEQVLEEEESKMHSIACVLTDIKTKRTKRKELMCIGRMEDLTGVMDYVIYPKTYETYRGKDFINPDIPLLVVGLCEKDESNNTKMIVREVYKLSESVDHSVSKIRLELDIERLTRENAEKLANFLNSNRGNCQVDIILRKNNLGTAYLKSNGILSIKWSPDVRAEIEQLTYPGTVHYVL